MKLFARTLLGLAALLVIAACGRGSEEEAAAPAPEPVRDRASARVRMAETLLAEGQVDGAVEQLRILAREPAHRITPDSVPAWTDRLLEKLILRGALAVADSLLDQTGPLAERTVQRKLLTANLRVLQGDSDAAVSIYASLRSDDPELEVRILHELATLHMQRGEWQAAIDRAREGLGLDPARGPLRILIARALTESGRADEALEALTVLPPSPARWATEAEIHFEVYDRPDTAVTLLLRARQEMKQDPGLALLLGRALLAKGDAAAAAVTVAPLARGLRVYPGSEEVLADAWAASGRIAAADSLRAVLSERREAAEVQALRIEGLRLSQAGDLPEALDRFDRALALDPSDGELHHDRGVVLARQREWDAARRAFEAAARLRPDDVSILVNLARLYDRTGQEAARDSILARVESMDVSPR